MSTTSILIADDDADDRYLLETAFFEKGYKEKIEFVENGVEVLNFLSNVKAGEDHKKYFPKFVLLDLNMPRKNGLEVLKEIKANSLLCKIPVIIFTTSKTPKDIENAYELGASCYVAKPQTAEEWSTTLGNLGRFWIECVKVAI